MAHIFEELNGVATCKQFNSFINALAKRSQDVLHLVSLDGAGSGWRWYAKQVKDKAAVMNEFSAGMHCVLHNTNLSSSATANHMSKRFHIDEMILAER